MMLWLLLYISLLPVLCLLYWWYQYCRYERYLKNIPGPPRVPLFGNALEFKSTKLFLKLLDHYQKKFKGNFKVYVGSQPYLFVSEANDLKFILSSTKIIKKSMPYRYLHNWLGFGLLTSTGEKWRKRRKLITPAFHYQILDDFVDVYNSVGQVLVKKLAQETDKTSTDVFPYLTLCTLDIICESTMGTSINAQENENSDYVKSVKTILHIVTERSFSTVTQFDFLYQFTNMYRDEKAALKILHGFSNTVIKRKKQELLAVKNDESIINSEGTKKKRAFLDLLLEHSGGEDGLTDEDIREEVDTFMFEGHDTTSVCLAFTLYCLANNPHVQEKVMEEMDSIFGDDLRPCVIKDLQAMQYLDLVIKESLRMYPSVPFYGRELTSDVNMNGQMLPKGLMVNIFAFGVQYNPNIYPNPDVFNPDRFLPENTSERDPFEYVPFSAGPRNCIGQKFAMFEMKCLLSMILRNFQLLPAVPQHKPLLINEAILKSGNGVCLQIKKRNCVGAN